MGEAIVSNNRGSGFDFSKLSYNGGLLVKEMQKRAIKVRFIGWDSRIIEAKFGRHRELFYDINSTIMAYPNGWIINDKVFTKTVLTSYGIKVAFGACFSFAERGEAERLAERMGYPVVIKPCNGSHGEGVFLEIKNKEELGTKINNLEDLKMGGYFILEKQVAGNEYRIFVTRNEFLAAVERRPANVVGNGRDNVVKLIQVENFRRMNPRINCLCEIKMDEALFECIEKQGLLLDYVPKRGERVWVRRNSNVSTGGDCIDVSDEVHKSVRKLAFRILEVLGIPYVGIDLICCDIRRELGDYVVCELNGAPGLSLHMMPGVGKSRNTAGALADLIFPETKK